MPSKLLELGRRFSDDTYASKDEVKAIYNLDNIDDIWGNVLSYREFYNAETQLRDSSQLLYKICLTKKLSGSSYALQTRLSQALIRFLSLPQSLQKEFLQEKQIQALEHTAKSIAPTVTTNVIRKLVSGEMESIPSHLFSLNAYLSAYRKGLSLTTLGIKEIELFNNLVSGEEETAQAKYRSSTSEDVINPLVEPESETIHAHLEYLVAFLANEEIPAILRALTIPYFFNSVRPFEYCNEETAALVSKAFLATAGFGVLGYVLNVESIAYSTGDTFFKRLKLAETSLDLTYVLDRFLAFIRNDETNIQDELKELFVKKAEITSAPSKNTATLKQGDIAVEEPDTSLALPIFPSSDNSDTIEATARKLREVHPQLKKKQAHFYAGHCTIGLHYTIEQFKELEHTVYETARTSMEDLASRGFYKKELIGKKFVYTPVPLKD